MNYKILGAQKDVALIEADEVLITNSASALDLIMSAQYETGCDKLILYKQCFTEDFFILSTGIAGEILQKFVNYHKKAVIIGDYSKYKSKPLKDFIYESNKGSTVGFLNSIEEALIFFEKPH